MPGVLGERSRHIGVTLLALLALVNSWAVIQLRGRLRGNVNPISYTWEGNDYPRALPVDLSMPVDYTYTEHPDYLAVSDDPRFSAAWESFTPPGYGGVYLGPNKRKFVISMYHQIHCLKMIRLGLTVGLPEEHVSHCMNYLLQMVLCAADTTLEREVEPIVLRSGVPDVSPVNVTHTCRDWTKVYEFVDQSYWD